MRLQPFHIGHERMIRRMCEESQHVTILIGSMTEHGTPKNPFSYLERKKMVQNRFNKTEHEHKLRIFGIADIGDDQAWPTYVMDQVRDYLPEHPPVSAYYCGSDYDGSWFRNMKLDLVKLDRTDQEFPFVSGTMVRDMCMYGDSRWKLYIHEDNHALVENLVTKYHFQRKR